MFLVHNWSLVSTYCLMNGERDKVKVKCPQSCPRQNNPTRVWTSVGWSRKYRVLAIWHLHPPQDNYQGIDLSNLCYYVIVDLDWACEMLQCGTHLLKDALTKRTVEAGNERMTTPLTPAQVCIGKLCITYCIINWVKHSLLCNWLCLSQHSLSPRWDVLPHTALHFLSCCLPNFWLDQSTPCYCIRCTNYTISCHLDVFFPAKTLTGHWLVDIFGANCCKEMKLGLWLVNFKKGMCVGLKQLHCQDGEHCVTSAQAAARETAVKPWSNGLASSHK